MENKEKFVKGIFLLLMFVAVLFAGALLKVMESVFKPLVLSIMLSFVFYPFIKNLSTKYKMPWWLATTLVYLFSLVNVFLLANVLSVSFKSALLSIPKYEEKFLNLYQIFLQWLQKDTSLYSMFGFDQKASLFANLNSQFNILEIAKDAALGFTGSVVGFMKVFFLVLLMSVFLLAEFKQMKEKVGRAFDTEGEVKVYAMIQKIVADVTHYISIKFLISLATGVLVFLVCLVFRMDFPLVWGFAAFCLNFIPTFGSIISCVITALFAIIQFYPSFWSAFFVVVLIVAINIILGNIVEPKIEGDNLGVSPFVILVSLSFWGWLWGTIGLIIAVPFVVIIRIICENVSYLKPIGVFLGSK